MITEEETQRPPLLSSINPILLCLASPEETALPADGAIAETLELFADEFKSLFPC